MCVDLTQLFMNMAPFFTSFLRFLQLMFSQASVCHFPIPKMLLDLGFEGSCIVPTLNLSVIHISGELSVLE